MNNSHRSLLKSGTVALLAVAQFYFRTLALCDVFNYAEHLQELPLEHPA